MLSHPIDHVSIESFRQHSAGKKVVLLYPWANYRTVFLTSFLSNAKDGLLYYRVRKENATLSEWLLDLSFELEKVLGTFGSGLRQAVATGNASEMGIAFARELNNLRQPIILFIDDFDRVPMTEAFGRFINAAVEHLNDDVQIALSSRLIAHQPWNALIDHGEAVVLGNQQRRTSLTFQLEAFPKPQLEIFAFGPGRAFVNGDEITQWDGALPRALFFYLVDRPLVTRDEIFSDFWPNLSVKDATDIFHVTKHKITEVIGRKLGGSRDYELTAYKQGFYIPSEKMVRHYDVDNFRSAIERGLQATNEQEAEILLTRAIDLYKAHFLTTIEAPWALRRREQLALEYSEAVIYIGRILARRGEDVQALENFERALAVRPEREDVHREVISLLIKLGRENEAREHYARLAAKLRRELGIEPSPETAKLIESLN